jgi:hypothetical protein
MVVPSALASTNMSMCCVKVLSVVVYVPAPPTICVARSESIDVRSGSVSRRASAPIQMKCPPETIFRAGREPGPISRSPKASDTSSHTPSTRHDARIGERRADGGCAPADIPIKTTAANAGAPNPIALRMFFPMSTTGAR